MSGVHITALYLINQQISALQAAQHICGARTMAPTLNVVLCVKVNVVKLYYHNIAAVETQKDCPDDSSSYYCN